MAARARWVTFGSGAIDALGKEIAAAKRGNALAPVTVIVSDHAAEVWLRRGVGSRVGGIANVSFVTWEQLALDLVGPELERSGQRRLSVLAFAAAIRVQLRETDGPLGALSSHSSTERLVMDSITRVRSLPPSLVAALAESSRALTRAIALMGPLVRERLGSVYDSVDVMQLAAKRLNGKSWPATTDETLTRGLENPSRGRSAPVIVALPRGLGAPERGLLAAVSADRDVVLLVGSVGQNEADGEERRRVLSWGVDPGPEPAVPAALPTMSLNAPDPEEEIRSVLRWCVERRAEGTAWSDMAILYCASEPYLRLLHQHLERAGITHSGPGLMAVGETLVGQVIGSVGRLVTSDLSRSQVMGLLASAPIHRFTPTASSSAVPASLWDRVSRNAGIVRGRSSWTERLDEYIDDIEHRAHQSDRLRQERHRAQDLASFMASLIDELDRATALHEWSTLTNWLLQLLAKLLPAASREAWTEAERRAAEHLELAISRLGDLDAIDPSPSWDGFWQAVEAELSRPTGRIGRLGDGVAIGPLDAVRGAEFVAVAIVGCTEAALPRPMRGDSVFGPNDFDVMGWDAPIDTPETQRRNYLAALSAGSTHRLVSWPRSDPRRGRQVRPSRWADPLDLPTVPTMRIGSALSALADGHVTLDAAEERLARLIRAPALVGAPQWQASDVLAAGATSWRAKLINPLSEWSGSVGPGRATWVLEQSLSITALERFVNCPTRYLFADVLRVRDVQRPDDVESLGPLDRGQLTHKILELFIQDRMDVGRPESPDVPWSPSDRSRLHEIAEGEMAALEATGTPLGRELLWILEQGAVHSRLDAFLDADDDYRRSRGARPDAVERQWISEPLEVELPSGRRLTFAGVTDRIDRLDNGGIALIDYKVKSRPTGTSSADIMSAIESGELLQLPLYARAAARELPDADAESIRAAYWYLLNDGTNRIVDVDLATVDQAFLKALDVVAGLIEEGHFPVRPGEVSTRAGAPFSHCTYCEFDSICSNGRADDWLRASATPELTPFISMLSGINEEREG